MSEQTKNKIFWWVFALLILGSVVFTYIRIFINLDYMLVAEVSCDPSSEACFVYTSEELCVDSGEENCIENTEAEYYKIIHKKAANVSVCDPETLKEGETCPELTCSEGESRYDCYYESNGGE